MSRRRRERRLRQTTDPVEVPGTIAGPGLDDPYSRDSVVVDSSNAVLLDSTTAAVAHITRAGEPGDAIALTLGGRINQRTDRAEVLFLFDLDGAAAIVAELVGLAYRAGRFPELDRLIDERMTRMPR